ncbi:MAG: site-specific integrase [Treponema sp.]|nr:site-specific integrase [Treponema sp.]
MYQKETRAGPVWYVRFWNETARRYAVTRSTGVPAEGKRQRRYEAEQVAREILPRIQFAPPPTVKTFIQYLEEFWKPDSPYVREAALVKKRPLSAYYIHMNHEDVRRHIASFPPFQGIALQRLTPALIRDWLTWMAGKGLSGHRINHILLGMRVAVRYAVTREELDRDPFRNIGEAAETSREKGILTSNEIARLIAAPISDPRHRLAVLLGTLCGMRMGEVRGLQWGDIEDGLIHIRHNWIDGEGLKAPKCKGGAIRENTRTVPLPVTVAAILETLRGLSTDPSATSFVIEASQGNEEPVSRDFFRYVLDKELASIGISGTWKGKPPAPADYVNEQKQRNLTFHGLRHTFITLGRLAGITDLEIQALAGHKSSQMMERYSHASQVLDFTAAREKLEKAVGEAN